MRVRQLGGGLDAAPQRERGGAERRRSLGLGLGLDHGDRAALAVHERRDEAEIYRQQQSRLVALGLN